MINAYHFLLMQLPSLIEKSWQQLYLSLGAVCIATLFSLPLGLWLSRKNAHTTILACCSLFQTLPSLALLGFLLPILGIGAKSALVALSFYAILPIIRNTVMGIKNIPAHLLEAADSLGFTAWQRMKMIELPLALPTIIAGLRTATAMSVGVATLAAVIGAGGLGDFIYEGLSLNDTSFILLGTIPVALLALMLDFLIARLERVLLYKPKPMANSAKKWLIGGLIASVLLSLCFLRIKSLFSGPIVRIGSKNFTEQIILGELMAQLIEAHTSMQVSRKFNLGGTFVAHQALIRDEIDLYPEYTGTAYTVILKAAYKGNQQDNIALIVQKAYKQKYQLTWLPGFGFNNTNVLAVKRDFAKQRNLTSISDLKPYVDELIIGVSPDFIGRADGFLGLSYRYHLAIKNVKLMDPGLMYQAVSHNDINTIMAFSTDARLWAPMFVLLIDDKHLFPPYFAAPVGRIAFFNQHPEVVKALSKLENRIDDNVMRALNYAVDIKHRSPADVARAFLRSQQLISQFSH